MNDDPGSMVVVERAFRVDVEAGVSLHERAEAVMSGLVTLSEDGTILDSAVSSDLDRGVVEIEVTVAADDLDEGIATASSAMRSAIHGAGGATRRWPSDRAPAAMVAQDMRAALVGPVVA